MLKTRTLVLFACLVTVIVTVSQFPLALALSMADLKGKDVSIERVSGTIWSGMLHDAAFAGTALGHVQVKGKPLSAIGGGVAAQLRWQGAQSTGKALVQTDDAAITLTGLEMRMPLAAQGLRGVVAVSDGDIQFAKAGCVRASGKIVFNSAQGSDVYYGVLDCNAATLMAVMDVGGARLSVPLRSPAP